MTAERRNPYLILGVPHGATKGEAASGFARATRRLKRLEDPPYDLEDLNWALHQVEQVHDEPDSAVETFRVPADPLVYSIGGFGLLIPPLVPMERESGPTDPSVRVSVAGEAAAEILSALLEQRRGSVQPEPPFEIEREDDD